MLDLKIDAEFSLALLGVFAIILIVATILFVTVKLGIKPYDVLPAKGQGGEPCDLVKCSAGTAQQASIDFDRGVAYCQCSDGSVQRVSFAG
jgi:hypothetical protein